VVGAPSRQATKEERTARVIGIDPGTVATGWGVIDGCGSRLSYVASGVIRPRGVRAARLGAIYRLLRAICDEYSPATMVIEQPFVGKNIQTALRLGEARGATMTAAEQEHVAVAEYSPAEIKVAVAGNGRAGKEQVQAMVARLLALEKRLAADEADALGAAICHLHTSRFASKVEKHGVRRLRAGVGRARPAVRRT